MTQLQSLASLTGAWSTLVLAEFLSIMMEGTGLVLCSLTLSTPMQVYGLRKGGLSWLELYLELVLNVQGFRV